MFLTHTNSVYTEEITLLDHIPYPQYVHQISDGGVVVKEGIKSMPGELIDYVLNGKHGADYGTAEFIHEIVKIPNRKIGLILAAGGTMWTGYQSYIPRTNQYPSSYKLPPLILTQVYAGYLANKLGEFDYISTDSNSCISGHSAWYTAFNMLKLELLDAVVVISVDNGISEEYLHVFGEQGISKQNWEENDPTIQKFRVGHGCNISIFESVNMRCNYGHVPLAEIIDICTVAEMHKSPMGISPNGQGYRKVIDSVNTENINFIKTHGTFTADNEIEDIIIKEKFKDIPTINYKLRIGHTMGASTAIETALAIKENLGRFLSLGAGMGNVFSAAVVDIK